MHIEAAGISVDDLHHFLLSWLVDDLAHHLVELVVLKHNFLHAQVDQRLAVLVELVLLFLLLFELVYVVVQNILHGESTGAPQGLAVIGGLRRELHSGLQCEVHSHLISLFVVLVLRRLVSHTDALLSHNGWGGARCLPIGDG